MIILDTRLYGIQILRTSLFAPKNNHIPLKYPSVVHGGELDANGIGGIESFILVGSESRLAWSSSMEILREQLGALLYLEVKYATRDYLLDLTSRDDDHCDSITSGNTNIEDSGNSTTSQNQFSPSGKELLRSGTLLTEEGEKEGETNDASLPSMAASSNANSTVITEQNAVSWREKICEWSYQGE